MVTLCTWLNDRLIHRVSGEFGACILVFWWASELHWSPYAHGINETDTLQQHSLVQEQIWCERWGCWISIPTRSEVTRCPSEAYFRLMNTSKHGPTWDLVVVWGIFAFHFLWIFHIPLNCTVQVTRPMKASRVQMNEFKVLTGYDEQVLRCWSRNYNQIVIIIVIITINIIFKLKKRIFNKVEKGKYGPWARKAWQTRCDLLWA